MATCGAAYYEQALTAFAGWRTRQYDEAMICQYRSWWLEHKLTKPTHHRLVSNPPVEVDLGSSPRVIWFGQVHNDAARLWQVSYEERKALYEDALRIGAWFKPHPYDDVYDAYYSGAGLRVLPRNLSIHSLIPQVEAIMVANSNVGMEAFMFDKPVAVYGRPIYGFPELVNDGIDQALDAPRVDWGARGRYLSYIRDHHHLEDTNHLLHRIRQLY